MSFPHRREGIVAWIEKRPRCHTVAWELDPENNKNTNFISIFNWIP
ncbi:hypothetical protein RBEAN4_0761 [Rickettsia bellii str. RML An4]|uniref:Uncharacterized protein n=1 Tax=Rickettsia bellii str. RML An4 TaxID=1359193 RepID=A0A0F3QC92_RICBE|nr:hypothetical protein RBEAN4_0761 [Rickettsia bellii str. RML An4]